YCARRAYSTISAMDF
nr:immunoglobulin heavy chain junction region [Mus musculus]